ncbi:MAG: HU family DNA-binding protein [Candidatus Contendobacter sp.]|nr:HU family DNA-binding protein [Candidatus Contendobacter sp.]MDS4060302.1 HU family DNA-binding protein [Candidatus Contendobacter sp.]
MSTPATSFRLFYPDSNTVTALALFGPDGAPLTPQTVADGSGDPAGFKSKVITLASAAEPLLCTPTFQTPGSPVSLYLCRDDAGTFKQVLDETVFNPASPGRPTPKGDASQHLLYTATDLGGGIKTYAVKAPVDPVCLVKDAGKDPITGADLDGNTILFRWTGVVPGLLEVEADIEDITDPSGFAPVSVSNLTTYAESSVGLALVKAHSQIVPKDGLGHVVNFRLRYNVNGDAGAWVAVDNVYLQYDLDPPNPPTSLTATLLRDRVDTVPDVVKLDWVKDAVSPGDGIEIFATDYLGKKHSLYTSNGPELTCRVENVSRFVVQDTGPAVARPYVFSIVATNISAKSSEKTASAPLNISSKVKAVEPPTPDEIAGTARAVEYATLKAEVHAAVLATLGTLPTEGQAIVNATVDQIVLKIKDVVAKGGSVALQDFGVMGAKWTKERLARNPATGAPVVVPAYRSLGFTPSIGFKTGTRQGVVMTDAQAKPAP